MILRPIIDSADAVAAGLPASGYAPAWEAIVRVHNYPARAWWLVSQPDHAALSGTLAQAFAAPGFPAVDAAIARAIGVHDAGWAVFPSETAAAAAAPGCPPLRTDGRPLAFFEIQPTDFLRAWAASIERAGQVCATGGYIVSRHFAVLGEYRLRLADDPPEIKALVRSFVAEQQTRQQRWRDGAPPEELEALVRVLQFCDLLSLYLCCGSSEPVEFPQEFPVGRVRASHEGGALRLEPSPFQARGGLSVAVEARRWPPDPAAPATRQLAFLLS